MATHERAHQGSSGGERERGREAGQSTPHAAPTAPSVLSPQHLLALQRAVGNRAVSAMLAQRRGGGSAGADPVQRATAHTVLRSPGRALDTPVRAEMEARLGADFSQVRLHTDAAAQRSASELGARAYTSGEHIVIGSGGADKHTLAHELTHVIQQRQGPVAGTDSGDGLRVSDPSDRFERAAEANATRVMAGPLPDLEGSAQEQVGGRPNPAGTSAVQRAVGFEFEAQWNVRRMQADSEQVRQQRSDHRQRVIRARMLERFLSPYSGYHKKLLAAASVQADGAELQALRTEWFGDDALLTASGEQIFDALQLTDDEYELVLPSLLNEGLVPEEPLAGENLGKGRVHGLVVGGTKFDLTADASPTGGSNLEWVTDPLTDVAQVNTVMDDVTAMAAYLDGRQGDRFIPSEDVTAGGGRPEPGLRIYPDGKPLAFAPQATLGAALGRLPKLVKYLDNKEPMGLADRIPGMGKRRKEGRRQASVDLASSLGELPVAKSGAETAIAGLLPQLGFQPSNDERKTLTGLVTQLAAYLIQGQNLQAGANAKSIAGALMARTDFAHGFSLLPQNLRNHFQADTGAFVRLVLQAANMAGTGNARVFGSEVERGMANDRTRTTVTLTRAQWLGALPAGHDLLKNWENLASDEQDMVDEDSARAVHKSLGALGQQQNLVGPQGSDEAVVAELRRMKDNIATGELKRLAVAVFNLVEQLNARQPLNYQK
ncbi:eCIS core domain-containing protein [Kitasatospora acidiphila]|uniref:eCIS core domain-containing protein n=1 Tax=Kitasatospora acidiphila TaxID=2567942 RepID=UPI001C678BDD